MRQIANAVSPSNFVLTNPELLRETVLSNADNLVRGMRMLAEDIESGGGELKIRQSDASMFAVGRNLATSPGKVVFQNELMQLIQFAPSTAKVLKSLRRLERYPFQGILSVCPYYNRPSEAGIRQHFAHIAAATDRKILIYNIPYRTGVNLSNDTVLALSEVPNVVGIKDSCANLGQSLDLLRRRPTPFSVMTGEDALYYTMLAHRGNGGILASAHFQPEVFLRVYALMTANDHHAAHQAWSTVQNAVQLFFKEPNPAPLKYWLWRQGLIRSAECRLPLAAISTSLARELDLLSA